MDARKHFLVVLLSAVAFLGAVQAVCDPSKPLDDPDPEDDTVKVTSGSTLTQIDLKENYPSTTQTNIRIAVFNCDESDEATIGSFLPGSGSQTTLGVKTEKHDSKWYLVVSIAQDYENTNQRFYRFYVDAGLNRYEVALRIQNVDDEIPFLLLPDPTPCEIKETQLGQSSCFLVARDADAIMDGMQLRVLEGVTISQSISLVEVTDKDYCEPANPKNCLTVALNVKEELEFINRPVYSLVLEVEDQARHIGTLSYVVQVIAENKEKPHFTPQQLEIYLDEGKPGIIETSEATRITVSDRDALDYGQFRLSVEVDGLDDCSRAFDVIPSAGYRNAEVKLSVIDPAVLDYDKGSCKDIIVKIIATEISDDSRTGEAEVNIKLRDLNDESPEFKKEEYVFSVYERESIGTHIDCVEATDDDVSDTVTYSLASTAFLKVDPDTGCVSVNADIYYGRQQQVFATVRAEDTAEPPHFAYAQIVVNVNDINDMRPVLTVPWNPVNLDEPVAEDTELNVGITAFDEDIDADLSFSIDWENSRAARQGFPVEKKDFEGCLVIEPLDVPGKPNNAAAILKVEKEIHWEVFDTLYLNIIVDDSNTHDDYQDNRNANAMLTISINNINDCYPVFSEIRELTFKENTEPGKMFEFIRATDEDGPGFNDITYSIINILNEKEYVTIESTTGELRTGNDSVDFEEMEVLHYTVVASDGEFETPLNITIQIEDVNDNTPYFIRDYTNIIYNISENSTEIMELLTLEAKDDDKSPEFHTLRYFVEDQYAGTFEIDTETGRMFVPEGEGAKLDYEKVSSFSIEVTVRDRCQNNGCYFDSLPNATKITVQLTDINDNPPVIQNGGLLRSIEEDRGNPGVQLGVVVASDLDSGENAVLKFEFVVDGFEPEDGQDLFAISDFPPQSASITVKNNLLNKYGDYTLKVRASDPNFEDVATFIISVTDVNNNKPVFEFPTETTVLRFNIFNDGAGSVLSDLNGNKMVFRAVDDVDNGRNGTDGMTYSVLGDDTATKYLEMRGNELWLIQDFELEMERSFKLQLHACDGEFDYNQLCTEMVTDVRMRFNEELEPTFDELEWETSFTENKTGLNEVQKITVPVRDVNNLEDCQGTEDDCELDKIYYFVFGEDEGIFLLNRDTGELSLKQELDREEADTHTLVVVITNRIAGPPPAPAENSKLKITIRVNDIFDTAPKFNKSLFAAGINYGDRTNLLVTTLDTTFYDLNDKLTYSIIANSMSVNDNSLQQLVGRNPFVITGDELRLNFDFQDAAMKGIFSFKVQVINLGGFTDEAECQVYIISEDNLVSMRFRNNQTFVESKSSEIANVYSNVFGSQCNVRNVARATGSNGILMEDQTDVTSYFVDDKEQKPISKEEITRKLTDKQTYDELRRALFALELDLYAIAESTDTSDTNMEGVLQTVLIVVSVVLGTLVVVLFAAFFIRTRSLNRRLEALSTTKFGSQESGLNRVGLVVPNTNQHAIEGSNPIWGNEEVVHRDYDNVSVSSGDSDLIGVEDNPEFSPYAKSGVENNGFTPESATGRRVSVNPMFAAGLSQLSAAELQESATGGRSAKRKADMQNNDDYDSENDSRRSSEIVAGQNSNFTFYGKMDSIPTTEL